MKPAPFEFIRAHSLAEACRLLAQGQGEGRVIAGAQSLGPMLNLRLARPQLLIDITGIPELSRIEEAEDAVTLGACVTTANIEDGRVPGRGFETLPAIAGGIAYRAVRNRGTIGGSLCHADPAADWACIVCALGGECLVADASGKRWLPASAFVTGAFANALASSELLEAIRLPRPSPRARLGYYKICRKAGEFALAMSAVMNDPERGLLRLVIGATNGRPIIVPRGAELLQSEGSINEGAALQMLEQSGIADRVVRRQQLTALVRAYARAVQ